MSKQDILKKYCYFCKDCKDCDTCWTNNIFNESELRRFRSYMVVRMAMNQNANLELDTVNKCCFLLGEKQFDSFESCMITFVSDYHELY